MENNKPPTPEERAQFKAQQEEIKKTIYILAVKLYELLPNDITVKVDIPVQESSIIAVNDADRKVTGYRSIIIVKPGKVERIRY